MHPRLPPRPATTLVIGISGGIAAGKSAASRALTVRGGRVIAADTIAHEVLESSAIQERVRATFGAKVFAPDGTIDRTALARVIFEDPIQRESLEGWIHPAVRARIMLELSRARAENLPVVVLDVPLLFENDADHHLVAQCDALVFIDAHASTRAARAARDRGWESGEVARREALQLPLKEKRQASHFVIANHGDIKALETEAQRILDALCPNPSP